MRVRRTVHRFPLLLSLMVLMSSFHVGQSVWSLSIPNQVYIVGSVSQFCSGMRDLTRKQAILCEENRELMPSIRYGAGIAIQECHYQFQYRRWNCSVPERDSNTLFNRITGKDTKEAAFTYAISSAGVVHSIARACMEGNLSKCGCSRERRPKNLRSDYQWGGCGDNIEYGTKFTRKFMTAGEDPRDEDHDTKQKERKLVNLHNIEAGIQAVQGKAPVTCKCHGVSGACNVKTCKRELAPFTEIGSFLHMKYNDAVRVRMEKKDELNILQIVKRKRKGEYRRDNGKLKSTNKKPEVNSLVYIKDSPDYCVRSSKKETPGTHGRSCRLDTARNDIDVCDELCCGRGHRSDIVFITERCRCKFHWCCEITCSECASKVTRYSCN